MDTESPIVSAPIEYMPTATPLPQTSSSRCTQCNVRRKDNTRNLVVCIDGTSNEFGPNSTNVVKLFQKIDQHTTPEQHACYFSGIGTGSKSSHILNRIGRAVFDRVDMAIAWNVGETVKKAYDWLAKMYQDGDQIYLFGFSRGAYQVRVLAGMIHEVGLLRVPTEKQIETAYDHYASKKSNRRHITQVFKRTFSWEDLRVHFVGVWDTVSSVGLGRGDVSLSTSSTALHACHFRHALALDELRVKFMPEYLQEIHTHTDDEESKYIITSSSDEHTISPMHERRGSSMSYDETDLSGGKKQRAAEIKEVWFAGCHSDVGGTDRPGKSRHAGNVSLLWMRREAAASGLVLQPTDIVWVPDDLDLGTSNSMTHAWRVMEYMPITHQTSFSGAGDNAVGLHRLHPRRIIPGQKIHASILYANAYRPQASLGEGFHVPVVHAELDPELDDGLWETGLFEETAAQELIAHLAESKEVVPMCLDALLFMLRTEEGRRCIRNVSGWKTHFMNLIHNPDSAPLTRLITIVAYYEASCDLDAHPDSPVLHHVDIPQEIFDDAKKSLNAVLAEHRLQDGPRVVALLRPLTKHHVLRERILTEDVLETLMKLFDVIVNQGEAILGQAMDGLDCLLHCEDIRDIIINMLSADFLRSDVTRLSRILEVNDPRLLAVALRVVMTLARIPESRAMCSVVKPRIRELAKKEDRLVGLPAAEILLALYDPTDPEQLSLRDAHIRVNVAGALVRLNADRHDSAHGQGHGVDSGQEILRRIFGFDADQLEGPQKNIIEELKVAVQRSSARERLGATFTLLKLCESDIIRAFLRELRLLGIFIHQLQRKDSALLAAYALATCLKYSDMKESIKNNELFPKYIISMLQHNYFDDAVGRVEGFQIFGDFLQHADLREKLVCHDITDVLLGKLAKGKSKETRTSLICLDIFRSFDHVGHPGTRIWQKLRAAHEDIHSMYWGHGEHRQESMNGELLPSDA